MAVTWVATRVGIDLTPLLGTALQNGPLPPRKEEHHGRENDRSKPKQIRDRKSAFEPNAPTKPNPPPRDCAEAPARNPNGQHLDAMKR
jgi:hypothetical protein